MATKRSKQVGAPKTTPLPAVNGMAEGWAMAPLPDVLQINPPKPAGTALPPDTPVTFVPMAAVDERTGTIATPTTRPFSGVRKGYTAFSDGDVIMAKITPCMENGKTAIARDLVNGLGFGSTEFHVFRSTGAVLSEYLYHYLRQESFRRAAEDEMTGSVGQKRVPRAFLESTHLPLPPLAEQRRIVDLLEQILGKLGSCRDRLEKVPAILARFRQAVLAAACSGKLTEDWRLHHPDPDGSLRLVQQIRKERRLALGQREPVPPSTQVGMIYPDSWALASVDQLTTRITSGSRDWKRYYRADGPGTFIMAQNIRPLVYDASTRAAVAPPPNSRDAERSQVQRGDILVTIVGANTGDVCRVDDDLDRHFVCQSVALMRPAIPGTSPFIEMSLNSPVHGRAQYEAWIYGEGRPHLSFAQLRATAVPLAPLQEQLEIVKRVRAMFRLADSVARRLDIARAQQLLTEQSVLAKAFRGDLVPTEAELAAEEWRPHESAVTLLARIAATVNPPRKLRRSIKEAKAQSNG